MILEKFLLFTEIPTEKLLRRQISSPTFFLENIFDETHTHLGHLTSPCRPPNQVVAAQGLHVRDIRVRVRIKRHSGLGGQSGRKYVVVVKQSICRLSLGIQLSSHKFIALESH